MKGLSRNVSATEKRKAFINRSQMNKVLFNLIHKFFKLSTLDNEIPDEGELIKILHIMTKRGERTSDEINQLSSSLLDNVSFFNSLKLEDPNCYELCAKSLKLKAFKQGEYVVNEGDEGDALMIIVYGNISRYAITKYTNSMLARDYVKYVHKVKHEEKNERRVKRLEEMNKDKDELIKVNLLQNLSYDLKKVTFDLNFYSEFTFESITKTSDFKPVQSIGEAQFGKKDLNLNTYFTADSDCIIAILERKDYAQILESIRISKISKLSKIFKENFPIFRKWNKAQLSQLVSALKILNLKKGQVLYEQNSSPDYIYFTFNGQFEVSIYLDLKQYEDYIEYISNKNEIILTQIKSWKLERDKVKEILNKISKFISL